jgi:hypothetical protein
MNPLRRWVHQRARRGPATHARVSGQRRMALWMTMFAAVRTVAWIICMIIILVHYAGVGGSFIHAFIATSSSVLFVTLISFYCNASTDAANLMAGIAALFSADSHAATLAANTAVSSDFTSLESDIARLAALQPGPEADALAGEIRRRLGTPGIAAATRKDGMQ